MQPGEDPTAAIERAALRLLARREYAQVELHKRLVEQRGFAADAVGRVLQALAGKGLLDDGRYRAARLRSRQSRGQGPLLVARDWRMAGAEPQDRLLEEVDWLSVALASLRKRFGTQSPQDAKERARRARFLQSRGFAADTIRQALRIAEAEEEVSAE